MGARHTTLMAALNNVRVDLGKAMQAQAHHIDRGDTLRALGAEQERMLAAQDYYTASAQAFAQADRYAATITDLRQLEQALERELSAAGFRARISAPVLTAEQCEAVDDMAEFGARAAA